MFSSTMLYVKESVNCMKNRLRLTWKAFLKQVKASRKLVVGYGLFDENPFRLMWKAFIKKVKALRKWVVDNSDPEPWLSPFKTSFGTHAVVENLIILNVVVFLIWEAADPEFMMQNFMANLGNFRSGRLHIMITCGFSHFEVDHMVRNMICFYFHGKKIVNKFGPKFLLKLYLAGVVAGSAFFLLERASIKDGSGDSEITGLLGASAAVTAIQLLDLFYIPKQKRYTLLNFITYGASILLGIFIVWEDVLLTLKDEKVAGSAHLGGAAVAAIVCARLMMKKHL